MLQKPWPITLIAILHIISPVGNLFLFAWISGVSIETYLSSFDKIELIQFLFAFPVAGFAIWAVRWWSYPVFLLVMIWALFTNYERWAADIGFDLYYMVGANLINICLVTYFLIPAVRLAYFNPRMRWWESKPRYQVNWPATLDEDKREVEISNISEGGLFLKRSDHFNLEIATPVQIEFEFGQLKFSLSGVVAHAGGGSLQGYGVRFNLIPKVERSKLLRLIKALELLGFPRRPERVVWWKQVLIGVKEFVTTGKGLIPKSKM